VGKKVKKLLFSPFYAQACFRHGQMTHVLYKKNLNNANLFFTLIGDKNVATLHRRKQKYKHT
jgi:hypothetical protein